MWSPVVDFAPKITIEARLSEAPCERAVGASGTAELSDAGRAGRQGRPIAVPAPTLSREVGRPPGP